MTRPAGRAAVNAAAYPCNLLAIDPRVSSFGVFSPCTCTLAVISNEFHHRPWMMRDLDLSGNELIIFALVCEAGEKAYKKEYNQRIGKRDANAVMKL